MYCLLKIFTIIIYITTVASAAATGKEHKAESPGEEKEVQNFILFFLEPDGEESGEPIHIADLDFPLQKTIIPISEKYMKDLPPESRKNAHKAHGNVCEQVVQGCLSSLLEWAETTMGMSTASVTVRVSEKKPCHKPTNDTTDHNPSEMAETKEETTTASTKSSEANGTVSFAEICAASQSSSTTTTTSEPSSTSSDASNKTECSQESTEESKPTSSSEESSKPESSLESKSSEDTFKTKLSKPIDEETEASSSSSKTTGESSTEPAAAGDSQMNSHRKPKQNRKARPHRFHSRRKRSSDDLIKLPLLEETGAGSDLSDLPQAVLDRKTKVYNVFSNRKGMDFNEVNPFVERSISHQHRHNDSSSPEEGEKCGQNQKDAGGNEEDQSEKSSYGVVLKVPGTGVIAQGKSFSSFGAASCSNKSAEETTTQGSGSEETGTEGSAADENYKSPEHKEMGEGADSADEKTTENAKGSCAAGKEGGGSAPMENAQEGGPASAERERRPGMDIGEVLKLITSIKSSFLGSVFGPNFANDPAKYQNPSFYGIVTKMVDQLIALNNNKSYIAVIMGGRFSDLKNSTSDTVKALGHVSRKCDEKTTTTVVTGWCPAKGKSRCRKVPLLAKGAKCKAFSAVRELYDIPGVIKSTLKSTKCEDKPSEPEANPTDSNALEERQLLDPFFNPNLLDDSRRPEGVGNRKYTVGAR